MLKVLPGRQLHLDTHEYGKMPVDGYDSHTSKNHQQVLTVLGAILTVYGRFQTVWVHCGPNLTKLIRFWPILDPFWTRLADFGAILTEFGRFWTLLDPIWAQYAR